MGSACEAGPQKLLYTCGYRRRVELGLFSLITGTEVLDTDTSLNRAHRGGWVEEATRPIASTREQVENGIPDLQAAVVLDNGTKATRAPRWHVALSGLQCSCQR
jgi:hypothetical protein